MTCKCQSYARLRRRRRHEGQVADARSGDETRALNNDDDEEDDSNGADDDHDASAR